MSSFYFFNELPDFIRDYLTIPQLIGILGYMVGVSAFLQRSDNAFRWQLTLVNVIMPIHFYLLGPQSYPAAAINIINIFSTTISGYTKNIFVMLFFIILMWLCFFLTTPDVLQAMSYLSVIGTSLVIIALFRLKQQQMRLLILIACILWIIYSIWIESIGSIALEITFTLINIYTIIKLSKTKKNTI